MPVTTLDVTPVTAAGPAYQSGAPVIASMM